MQKAISSSFTSTKLNILIPINSPNYPPRLPSKLLKVIAETSSTEV
jgi:hypothetical protein